MRATATARVLLQGTVLEHSLPAGDYEVTGVDARGVRYHASFAVRGGAETNVVPVPRVE